MWSMSLLGATILAYMLARSFLNIGGKAMTPDEARAKIDEIEKTYGVTQEGGE